MRGGRRVWGGVLVDGDPRPAARGPRAHTRLGTLCTCPDVSRTVSPGSSPEDRARGAC